MTVTVRGTSHWHSLVTDLVTVPPVTVTRTVSAAAAATVTRAGRTVCPGEAVSPPWRQRRPGGVPGSDCASVTSDSEITTTSYLQHNPFQKAYRLVNLKLECCV